jgi:hypothetical protein
MVLLLGLVGCSSGASKEQIAATGKAKAAVNNSLNQIKAAMAAKGPGGAVTKTAAAFVNKIPEPLKKVLNVPTASSTMETEVPEATSRELNGPAGQVLAKAKQALEHLPAMVAGMQDKLLDASQAQIVNDNETVFPLKGRFLCEQLNPGDDDEGLQDIRNGCEKALDAFTAQIRITQLGNGVLAGLELAPQPGQHGAALQLFSFKYQVDGIEVALNLDVLGTVVPAIIPKIQAATGNASPVPQIRSSGHIAAKIGLASSACTDGQLMCAMVSMKKPIEFRVEIPEQFRLEVSLSTATPGNNSLFAIGTDGTTFNASFNMGPGKIRTLSPASGARGYGEEPAALEEKIIAIGKIQGQLTAKFESETNATLTGNALAVDVTMDSIPVKLGGHDAGSPVDFKAVYDGSTAVVIDLNDGLQAEIPKMIKGKVSKSAKMSVNLQDNGAGAIGQNAPKVTATPTRAIGELSMMDGSANFSITVPGRTVLTLDLPKGSYLN